MFLSIAVAKQASRFLLFVFTLLLTSVLAAQNTPDTATGLSPYAQYDMNGVDNVNPVNGNVFLKIPLLSYPQKGGKLHLDYSIYYNDKQWELPIQLYTVNNNGQIQYTYSATWNLGDADSINAVSSTVGAYVARDQYAYFGTDDNIFNYTYGSAGTQFTVRTDVSTKYWQTPDGARHYIGDGFSQTCQSQGGGVCPSGLPYGFSTSYPAPDTSGFDPYGHDANGVIYSVSGSNGSSTVSDPNGNMISKSSTGWTDTFNRFIPGTNTGPGIYPFPNNQYGVPAQSNFNGFDLLPGVPAGSVPSECPTGTTSARVWTTPGSASYNSGTVTYYLCYELYSYQTAFNLNSLVTPPANTIYSFSEASSTGSGSPGQALMLTAVVLPDGNMYTFQYDNYLSLIQLGLPSGGTISYTWQNIMFKPTSAGAATPSSTPISRAIASRTVTPGDGQPSQTTTYHWDINYTSQNGIKGVQFPVYSIVTDAEGNDVEHVLGGLDDGNTTWGDYIETGVSYYSGCSPHDSFASSTCSGSGTWLKSETYARKVMMGLGATLGTDANPVLATSPTVIYQTTLQIPTIAGSVPGTASNLYSKSVKNYVSNLSTSCTIYTYPATSNQPNESGMPTLGSQAPQITSIPWNNCYTTGQVASVATYDWGSGAPGALIKTESTTYAWQNSLNLLNANMLNAVSTDVITGSNGAWSAASAMCYDNYGDVTSTRKYPTQPTSYSCGTPPSSTSVSSYSYSTQTSGIPSGVIATTTDPNGNTTTVNSYACNGSLPTKVTLPDGENVAYTYDCNTGKVLTIQDQNQITNSTSTKYAYNDPLARLTSVTYPDGGSLTASYNDTPLSLSMTVQKTTGETAGNTIATTYYDGLARKVETQLQDSLSSSVTDTITSTTTYDVLGRVASVTNPYRSTSDSTFASTSYTYDALGRTISANLPYGAVQSNSFTGNCVTSTDEAGNQSKKCSDGAGRLTQVFEPNASAQTPSMPTNYTYDALGNLLTINQVGISGTDTPVTRSFAYDGLSRLVASNNPENSSTAYPASLTCAGTTGTWANCYTYDLNSNVLTKTDNRQLPHNGAFNTITYKYDNMNRLVSKSYNSGDPSACYQYNTSASSASDSNPKGYLTMEWTQPGSCPSTAQSAVPSTAINSTVVLQHDSMGRILSEQQCPLAPCTSAYVFNYTYDLAGNVTSSNNGMPTSGSSTTAPAITWGATYDAANRLSTVSVTNQPWSDSVHPAVLFQANQNTYSTFGNAMPYDPFGHLVIEQLGLATTSSPSTSGVTVQSQYDKRARLEETVAYGTSSSNSASQSFGSIEVSGTEQSTLTNPVPASSGTGEVILVQTAQSGSASITVTVNGVSTSATVSYSSPQTGIYNAGQSLVNAINVSSLPVTAGLSGGGSTAVVVLTAKTTGSGTNYSLSVSSYGVSGMTVQASGATLTGGANAKPAQTVYDAGTITVRINNTPVTYNWGQSSTSNSIALGLQQAIQSSDSSFLTASISPDDSNEIILVSKNTGPTVDWPMTITNVDTSGQFSTPVFSLTGEGMFTGDNGTIYKYIVPTEGYAANGNITNSIDTEMGTWAYGYDTLNRLTSASANSGPYAGQVGCWYYDSFGNRKQEGWSTGSSCPSSLPNYTFTYNSRNQISSSTQGTFNYDGAGNVVSDSLNGYLYDAEGRLCAVVNSNNSYWQYVYDAEGNRVARGALAASISSCSGTPTYSKFQSGNLYLELDSDDGQQVTELQYTTSLGATWTHTNAFAGGLLATYATSASGYPFAFHMKDPLGTRRVLTDAVGKVLQSCQSLPYGNGESCTPTPTEQLFTQKERDTESGNDFFGARYYSSVVGRWMSPDPSGLAVANATNPQSLNLYAYVINNPILNIDPYGLWTQRGAEDCFDQMGATVEGASIWAPACDKQNSNSPSTDNSNNNSFNASFVGNNVGSTYSDGKNVYIASEDGWTQNGVALTGGAAHEVGLPPIINMTLDFDLFAQNNVPNNGFTKKYLPANSQTCSAMLQFFAPSNFNLQAIVNAGHSNGLLGANAAVGQGGTFDFQRVKSGGNTTFYSGYTPVANVAVGAYLYGAGVSRDNASLISNTYALFKSSNGATNQQAEYRTLGWDLARAGWNPSCK